MVVLITAESCSACKIFKRDIWPRLGMYIERDTRLDLTELHVVKNYNEIRATHTDLFRFIGWFPTILIFTGESWVSTSLKGKVFNGQFKTDEDGRIKMTHYKDIRGKASQVIPLNHSKIYDWIEEVINGQMFIGDRPAVVITDDRFTTSRAGTTSRGSKSIYNDETEFIENVFEDD